MPLFQHSLRLSLLLALMMCGLMGCPDDKQVCPEPLLPGNLTPGDNNNMRCCDALKVCCAGIEPGEDKDKCEKVAREGAIVSCQAEYHTQVSFENCKPVYIRDNPEIAPNNEVPTETPSDAGTDN